MSTLTLDDRLYQQAAVAAAAHGQSVDEFVREALRLALQHAAPRRATRNGLPTIIAEETTPRIQPDQVRLAIEEEGG